MERPERLVRGLTRPAGSAGRSFRRIAASVDQPSGGRSRTDLPAVPSPRSKEKEVVMKTLLIAALALGLSLLPSHLFSQAAAPEGEAELLDMPDGYGFSDDIEAVPEYIEFYKDDYEGDAFFFCLDHSSSMGQNASSGKTKFEVLREETVRAIMSLSERSVVSIVFYDGGIPIVFGDPPVRMTAIGKAKMAVQVLAVQIGAGTCMDRGMAKALELATKTKNEHRTAILTADGRTTCPNGDNDPDRVFQIIMAKNTLKIPINTIYTGATSGPDWDVGKPLLERLARATNGKFAVAQ
jgi:hypothetical protein